MNTIKDLITSTQFQSVIDAVTSKSKILFVKKSNYEAKISELESTIGGLETRITELEERVLDLEKFHYPSAEENPPIEVEEEEEP